MIIDKNKKIKVEINPIYLDSEFLPSNYPKIKKFSKMIDGYNDLISLNPDLVHHKNYQLNFKDFRFIKIFQEK